MNNFTYGEDGELTLAGLSKNNIPLAVRMRPQTLSEFFGQEQVIGDKTWLRNAIEHDTLTSVILYGPSGTGKTTLARIVAHTTHAEFVEVSAIAGTVKDLRKEIDLAKSRLYTRNLKTILFVDEIHRFTKSQQDALLQAVEERLVVLIGATTENPYFEVNSALLSRSRVVELKALSEAALSGVIDRALHSEAGLGGAFNLEDEAKDSLIAMAGGDARLALTTLELASQLAQDGYITLDNVLQANPRPGSRYDKKGDMHYDVISAFIKSMRGSDPDASIYWLARMLDGGEDPKFIARRIFILASEDIGNADPQALLVAEAAFRATEVIGMPECRINLAQAAIYMALAPKSNASYNAINAALKEVKQHPNREVPSYLRDRTRPGSETYGAYLYPHNFPGGWVSQRYLPQGLESGVFYQPAERGWEAWRKESVARDRQTGSQ